MVECQFVVLMGTLGAKLHPRCEFVSVTDTKQLLLGDIGH